MKKKVKGRILAILMSLAMAFTMMPMMSQTVYADDPVYTVTLDPGEGSGDPIVFKSDVNWFESTSGNGSDVPGGNFYRYLGDGKIWFCFPDYKVPDTFTAPDDEYVFDEWTPIDMSPRGSYPISGDMTFTAQWKKDLSLLPESSYSLSPTSYTITQAGYTDIECVVTSLNIGKFEYNGQPVAASAIEFTLNKGTLTDGNGNSISFLVDAMWHFGAKDSENINPIGASNESFTAAVYIDENDFNAAAPGTYTGIYQIDSTWIGVDSSERVSGNPHSIALTLIVPDPSISHTVTFFDEDGTTVLQTGDWVEGSTPVYSGQTPTKPADAQNTYTFAGWNPAITPVTGDATYTATYTATPIPATHTVTYEVMNGTWSDDKTEAITEQVEDNQKPKNVPTGMKASEGYEGGSWNVDPTSASITGDTKFTYTFTKEDYVNKSEAATVYMGGIPWRVISYDEEGIAHRENAATLFSAEGLAQGVFNPASNPNNHYSDSNLQKRIDALTSSDGIFSDAEKAAILPRNLATGGYEADDPYTDGIAGNEVEGALLWPLSTKEARYTIGTLRKTASEDIGSYYWWLRSPGSQDNSAAFVRSNGNIAPAGTDVYNGDYRMRPAFHLDLGAVLFTSAATGDKTSITAGGEDLKWMGEYKLTLLDSTRKFDVKLYDVDGSKRTIRWTGAETGNNEYLSVVVKDSNGAVTHYDRLKKLDGGSDAAGQMEIDLSGIDMDGKTLYVFNEQCNGAKVTDYASALKKPEQVSKHTVTYEVVNGTWADDKDDSLTEQVYAGDKSKNVPTGMKPASGYEGGSWNINPSTLTITENTTFTYTFVEHKCAWEFTGFTWTGDETNGYTKAVAGYKCTKYDSHTTNVEAVLSDTTIEPICTKGGKTTYTATVAASVAPDGITRTGSKDAETTEATGHTFDQEKAEDKYLKTGSGCTHPAEYYMSCSKCGVSSQGKGDKEATFEFGEPMGHNYGKWTKLNDTQHQRVCEHDKSHVEKANHSWDAGKVTRAATITATGVKTYTCTACKATKTETIAKLPKQKDPEDPKKEDPKKEDPKKDDPKKEDPEKQYGTDGTPVGPGASDKAAEKAITKTTSDKDIKGAKFAPLKLRSTSQGKTNIKLTWTKNKKAVKYVVYGNRCNASGKKYKPVKLATVKGNKYNVKKIKTAKVKKGTYYKFVIVALNKNNKVVSTSKTIHVATKGGKVGNHKSVTVKAKVNAKGKAIKKVKPLSKTVLKKGKSLKLIVKLNPAAKKLKVKKHVGLRYETTNAKVATVSGSKIKAKRKGKCIVYAYTQNGVAKAIKITVK